MALTLTLFFIATFGIVSAGVIGYRFLIDRRALLGEDARGRDAILNWTEPSELLKSDSLSTISFLDRLLTRVDYVHIMKARIAEAGLRWSVGRLTALMLLVASFVFAVSSHLGRIPWWGSALAAVAAGFLPYAYVLAMRRRRLLKFEEQFPEALESLARALRAGHPLSAGLTLLAYESPNPVAAEMRVTAEERNLGRSWDQALDNLTERVPLVEVATFAASVKLQSRTGGKLSEVLARLAETMREASALKGEVRAVAAHGKLTGRILTVLPVFIAIMMTIVNPSYLAVLWVQPEGRLMLGGAVVCLVLAHFVIRKMVDIRI
jgi:tight adherence protein B